jgi:hypothetical protein
MEIVRVCFKSKYDRESFLNIMNLLSYHEEDPSNTGLCIQIEVRNPEERQNVEVIVRKRGGEIR